MSHSRMTIRVLHVDDSEEFASVVSHDLRNPLHVAKGRLELVTAECETPHHESIEDSLEWMQTLIDDLLSLARQGRRVDDTSPVELRSFLEGCWENLRTGEPQLLVKPEQTIPADPSRLRQLLENLLRNAVEHGGEAVTVKIDDLEDGFFVADDGAGITIDDSDRIFDSGFFHGGVGHRIRAEYRR
jgi:signal transduction histidine kinase